MQVDWFTVIAQVINFLVLVWLLKKFLYKPVLDAINARESTIATQLQNAAATMQQANTEKIEFEQKNALLQQQRENEMARAVEDAETYRQKLQEDARNEAEKLRTLLKDAVSHEQDTINKQLRQKTQEEVFAIASKTLADLASTSLEEEVVQVFIQRLSDTTTEEKRQISIAFNKNAGMGFLNSALDISQSLKSNIEAALRKITGTTILLQHNTNPALVSGIEVSTDGYKLSWNIDAYLTALEEKAASFT